MKKCILKFFLLITFFLYAFLPCMGITRPFQTLTAAARNYQVWDEAGLLTGKEKDELTSLIGNLEDETGWDMMAVTTEDAEGMDGTEYAETWFDANTGSDDGIIFLIDMDNKELVMRTFGEAIFYVTDERTENILDQVYDDVNNQEYAKAFQSMISGAGKAWQQGVPANQHTYNKDTGEIVRYRDTHKKITLMEFLIALGAALTAGGITIAFIIGKYRLKWGGYQYSFRENGNVKLTGNSDVFINQVITHRKIPKDPPGSSGGGGRSTVHTGAGGRTSGGGSRKF